MNINKGSWTFVGLFSAGALAAGFSIAVIALVQLQPKQYDNFDEERRKQLYITAWVYIGFMIAVFAIVLIVTIMARNKGKMWDQGRRKLTSFMETIEKDAFGRTYSDDVKETFSDGSSFEEKSNFQIPRGDLPASANYPAIF